MSAQPAALDATLESLRERARRLEQEAAALRSDLDAIAFWLEWETRHSVSPDALRKVPVSDAELSAYRKMLGDQFDDMVLRLAFQAQKIATHLKRTIPREEREAAIDATIQALHHAAAASGMSVPIELEVVIGD